jgi:hypothetical protein
LSVLLVARALVVAFGRADAEPGRRRTTMQADAADAGSGIVGCWQANNAIYID